MSNSRPGGPHLPHNIFFFVAHESESSFGRKSGPKWPICAVRNTCGRQSGNKINSQIAKKLDALLPDIAAKKAQKPLLNILLNSSRVDEMGSGKCREYLEIFICPSTDRAHEGHRRRLGDPHETCAMNHALAFSVRMDVMTSEKSTHASSR